MSGIQVVWYYQNQYHPGDSIDTDPQEIRAKDVEKLWIGPQAVFLYRHHDQFGYYWDVINNPESHVPAYITSEASQIVVFVVLIEKPQTIIHYELEGNSGNFSITLPKPASQIALAEVKNFFPGSYGVFHFKVRSDIDGGFFWKAIIDPDAIVPAHEDGCIFCNVKMKITHNCIVEMNVRGENNFFRLAKPASEVTLQDIRSFHPGPPCIFLFKVLEGEGAAETEVWTVWVDEDSPVPNATGDTISVRTQPFGWFDS